MRERSRDLPVMGVQVVAADMKVGLDIFKNIGRTVAQFSDTSLSMFL